MIIRPLCRLFREGIKDLSDGLPLGSWQKSPIICLKQAHHKVPIKLAPGSPIPRLNSHGGNMKIGQLRNNVFFKHISFLSLLLISAGCGSGSGGGSRSAEAIHLDKVGSLVTEYRNEHEGNGPTKLDDLKKWAIDNSKARESDFVSTRDKETYVLQTIGSGSANIMVREATGKNGGKFVIVSSKAGTMPAEEMSEARLSYSFGGPPPSGGAPAGGFPMGKPK